VDVVTATTEYERWLGGFCTLHTPDLEYKHARMSDPTDPFPFFRGTYYRWAQWWPTVCPDEADAPRVLAVGDAHVENFGTWRDANGRLCWGVNDFDEADVLPYTNDLIRLATSVQIAGEAGHLGIKLGWACRAILTGYREALEADGLPFVLEERHPELRALATAAEREPVRFWKKLTAMLDEPPARPPASAGEALTRSLPAAGLSIQVRFRPEVGMGSLGRPRYVMLAEWAGGWVAREAKAVAPPATAWAAGRTEQSSSMAQTANRAVRCPDPFYLPGPEWVVRRLAPECARIDIGLLACAEDVLRVFWAMGGETANVHLGTPGAGKQILRDVSRRPHKWLVRAAKQATAAALEDWQSWLTSEPAGARANL
jgi:Uncharacterized protein conserved in bacteria (DUF2252)